MEDKDYLDRLTSLKMYSQELRRERYQIIFIWKVSQGLVEGYEMTFYNSDRRGKEAVPKPIHRTAPASVKRAREASLTVKGARIFNLLPVWIRTVNGVTTDTFKTVLDQFLVGVPDQPTVTGRGLARGFHDIRNPE